MDLQEFQRLDIPNFLWYASGYIVPHEISSRGSTNTQRELFTITGKKKKKDYLLKFKYLQDSKTSQPSKVWWQGPWEIHAEQLPSSNKKKEIKLYKQFIKEDNCF